MEQQQEHEYTLTRSRDILDWIYGGTERYNREILLRDWSKWCLYMSKIPNDLDIIGMNWNNERQHDKVAIKMYRSMKYLWEIINRLQTIFPELINED